MGRWNLGMLWALGLPTLPEGEWEEVCAKALGKGGAVLFLGGGGWASVGTFLGCSLASCLAGHWPSSVLLGTGAMLCHTHQEKQVSTQEASHTFSTVLADTCPETPGPFGRAASLFCKGC